MERETKKKKKKPEHGVLRRAAARLAGEVPRIHGHGSTGRRLAGRGRKGAGGTGDAINPYPRYKAPDRLKFAAPFGSMTPPGDSGHFFAIQPLYLLRAKMCSLLLREVASCGYGYRYSAESQAGLQ